MGVFGVLPPLSQQHWPHSFHQEKAFTNRPTAIFGKFFAVLQQGDEGFRYQQPKHPSKIEWDLTNGTLG